MVDDGRLSGLPLALITYGDEFLELLQRDRLTGEYKNYRISISMLRGNGVGSDGKSAYQIAVDEGFVGNEAQWLTSLIGPEGASAYQVAVQSGFTGTVQDWLLSLKGEQGLPGTPGVNGANGLSAYQVAIAEGFVGDATAWLASLQGVAGTDGKSAYQLAQEQGFVGDLAAWLLSLKGDQGEPGAPGVDGQDGTRWLVSSTDPTAEEGAVNDYAYNTTSKEFFLKTGADTWTLQGKLTGIEEAPNNGGIYMRRNGQWYRLDRYDLAAAVATSVLDLAVSQVFRVDASTDRTFSFTNIPADDRAMVVIIKLIGDGGVITWPVEIAWDNGLAPELGVSYTLVTLFWDGLSWLGSYIGA